MKRLLRLLLAIAMCISLAACGAAKQETPATTEQVTTAPTEQLSELTGTEPTAPEEPGTATPILYRVTDEAGHEIWLFGSIHVGRPEYYPLPAYVTDAFDKADALAVEVDVAAFEKNMSMQVQALMPLVYRDGTKISDHISEELYTKAVAALNDLGSYYVALDSYCPAFWSSLIDSLMIEYLDDARIDLGIDRHLLTRATDTGKEIREIESAKEQYEMLGSFSDELQALLLEASVESCADPGVAAEELAALLDLWASGDEVAFVAYLEAEDESIPAHLAAEYNKAMLTDRNIRMSAYAEAALQSGGGVFICVGAAHVIGDGAMAQLLAQRGYTVERVTE